MASQEAATMAVAALSKLALEGLRSEWRARFGAPPKLRSPELLALMLAWRIQAEADGGIDVDLRRMLRSRCAATTAPVPDGVRIVREWQGAKHEVVSLPGGRFEYGGQHYKSLSQIARLITGSRWNGPRFFGLRTKEAA